MAATSFIRSLFAGTRNKYISMLAGNSSQAQKIDSNFEHIETVTVGAGGAASVTFSNIPQTYRHLQIRYVARSQVSTTDSNINLNFNSDTSANYAFHKLYANGSTAGSVAVTASTTIQGSDIPGNTAGANTYGAGVTDILDYTSTSKYKTVRTLSGQDRNGGGYVSLKSGLWISTSAISSITLQTQDGVSGSLMQYSTFSLYGIRG